MQAEYDPSAFDGYALRVCWTEPPPEDSPGPPKHYRHHRDVRSLAALAVLLGDVLSSDSRITGVFAIRDDAGAKLHRFPGAPSPISPREVFPRVENPPERVLESGRPVDSDTAADAARRRVEAEAQRLGRDVQPGTYHGLSEAPTFVRCEHGRAADPPHLAEGLLFDGVSWIPVCQAHAHLVPLRPVDALRAAQERGRREATAPRAGDARVIPPEKRRGAFCYHGRPDDLPHTADTLLYDGRTWVAVCQTHAHCVPRAEPETTGELDSALTRVSARFAGRLAQPDDAADAAAAREIAGRIEAADPELVGSPRAGDWEPFGEGPRFRLRCVLAPPDESPPHEAEGRVFDGQDWVYVCQTHRWQAVPHQDEHELTNFSVAHFARSPLAREPIDPVLEATERIARTEAERLERELAEALLSGEPFWVERRPFGPARVRRGVRVHQDRGSAEPDE